MTYTGHDFIKTLIIQFYDQSNHKFFDQAHPSIFQSTFNFHEFVLTSKKSGYFMIFFYRFS